MGYRNKYIITLFISLACWGCLEPFTFDAEDVESAIIVDGVLDNSAGPHKVTIANINKFGLKAFDGIGGASVSISDGSSTYMLSEAETGIYLLPEGVLTGVTGNSYQLNIILNDGTEIISPMEPMPAVYTLDEANAEFDQELVIQQSGGRLSQYVVKVTVSTELPESEETIYLRYAMDEVYSFPEINCGPLHTTKSCYVNVSSNSQDFALFNSNLINNRNIKNLLVATKRQIPQEEFASLHYFSIYQHVLNRDAYLYWEKVQQLINQNGTVFDLPPATVPGNLVSTNSEIQVLGYFQVSTVDIKRASKVRADYVNLTGFQTPCSPFGEFIPACCNCLLLENSTTERPPWF